MAKRHPRTSTPCPMGYLELSTILEHELNPGEQPTPENTMSPAALHQLEKRDTPETSCYGRISALSDSLFSYSRGYSFTL
ncbi:hypothetical protein GBAR_LOCUS394 [Geodia barretti]|uniref:Uncharacterized protein n=1 Tax=Geodia barretti TaxID=519541 RepID=A0AA35QST0_GEOBA|nr:hypothetical protein GBAR_LOCUS394 [Geodia barretti]